MSDVDQAEGQHWSVYVSWQNSFHQIIWKGVSKRRQHSERQHEPKVCKSFSQLICWTYKRARRLFRNRKSSRLGQKNRQLHRQVEGSLQKRPREIGGIQTASCGQRIWLASYDPIKKEAHLLRIGLLQERISHHESISWLGLWRSYDIQGLF